MLGVSVATGVASQGNRKRRHSASTTVRFVCVCFRAVRSAAAAAAGGHARARARGQVTGNRARALGNRRWLAAFVLGVLAGKRVILKLLYRILEHRNVPVFER